MLRTLERMSSRSAARYIRLVGGHPSTATGPRPLQAGSSIPGFAITELDAPHRVVLRGRHRFSDYQLAFHVEPTPTGSRVTAESRAVFPGFAGDVYRLLVIGTRLHILAVRRMLRTIVREAAAS